VHQITGIPDRRSKTLALDGKKHCFAKGHVLQSLDWLFPKTVRPATQQCGKDGAIQASPHHTDIKAYHWCSYHIPGIVERSAEAVLN
jgi:hypothetical protein